jgi:hypothetical protein
VTLTGLQAEPSGAETLVLTVRSHACHLGASDARLAGVHPRLRSD